MNQFRRIKDQIMVPSEDAQKELREKIEAAWPAPGNNLWLRRAVPLAACLLLVIGGVLVVQQRRGPSGIVQPPKTTAPVQGTGEITGLPIGQPSSDTPCEIGISADRQPFVTLESFFIYGDLKTFVLARVMDTQLLPPENSFESSRQQSTLEVIGWAYNQPAGAQEPAMITLTQPLYHGDVHTCVGEPMLLRRGGVYLLPLGCFDWEGADYWYVMGDVDVLFEVDDRGLLYSHSSFADFAAYDGRPHAALMEDVRAIVRDNPLLVQYPRFARVLNDEVPLALITVLDGGTKGSVHLTQRVRAEQILVQGTGRSWQVRLSEGEFRLNTYGHEAKALPGERYLAFIYGSEMEYSFQPENAARINADGTITPLANEWGGWNAFDELAGMTVVQVRELMEKAENYDQPGLR